MAVRYDGPDLTLLAMAAYKAILRDVAAGYQPPPAGPKADSPAPEQDRTIELVAHRIVEL